MVVIILDALIVLAPIPLTNVVPALLIALISLAYLEEDGLLLGKQCCSGGAHRTDRTGS